MAINLEDVSSSAVLSEDEKYRYHLSRWWALGPHAVFVMLNPSTADERTNDATILKCMGFAERWGFAGIDVVNIYAWRETKPKLMWTARSLGIDIVGKSNDTFLTVLAREAAEKRAPLVAAWGANAEPARVAQVLALPHFDRLQCLSLTKSGMPGHPLYLKNETELQPYRGVAA